MKSALLALIPALLLFGCCCASVGGGSPAQVVEAYQRSMYSCQMAAALGNCNVPPLSSLPAAEQQQWQEEIQGLGEQEQECKATGYMPQITKFQVQSEQIQGDRAQVEVYMCLQDPGDPQEDCNTYTQRLEKVNGQWKIYLPDCGF